MENNEKSRKYIVFGGDGLNPLGIVRSLGEIGIKTDILRNRESEHYATIEKSKYVNKVYYGTTSEELLTILLEKYGHESLKPIVFFTDEGNEAFFDSRFNALQNKFIFYNAGVEGGVNHLLRKDVQCELAIECGIKVPIFEVLETGVLPTKVSYPVITKTLTSNDGRWKQDMMICHNEDELKSAYKEIQAQQIMVEEFIDGTNEVDLKGFSIRGGEQICFTSLKKWKFKDLEHKWLMYFEPCQDMQLKNKLSDLIRKANYSGIFDAEFIQTNNGELVFLEVNWRTGMFNYNHTVEGINLPYLWSMSTIHNRIEEDTITFSRESYTAMDEIDAFADVLRHPNLFLRWLKAIKKADLLYYYNRKDIRPCLTAWGRFFKRKLRKLLG